MVRQFLGVVVALLVAAPAFGQVPNMKARIEQLARDNPNTFTCAHTPAQCGHNFVKLVACKLNPEPSLGPWGLNGKRGNPRDLSYDALNYRGVGPGTDITNPGVPVTVIDFIVGAGAPGAHVNWNAFDDPVASSGAWVRPSCKGDVPIDSPGPVTPTPPATKPYPGDAFFVEQLGVPLEQDYAAAGQTLNPGAATWFARTIWRHVMEGMSIEQSITQSRKEWRAALGLPSQP